MLPQTCQSHTHTVQQRALQALILISVFALVDVTARPLIAPQPSAQEVRIRNEHF